ncbi:MAG TPA: twin-arginine translocase TatA/TatE family subunit [Candidatus Omnitrophota bacterium]|nr:twin-arginine translocase TatA/TatE family subunit [Candidatus Omnitrophota bacterium]HPB68569.1 twin-arginine translocase TatA/TatE family subunit [Candidatus Omnitrophota bacterium]HQO58025.1 twin-arginine translocase TatA/TatE family subunit [Candidatus Omnitrophota bacterium]
MFGLGFQEILLILIVALLLFGAARLPEIGRALGKALSEFKKGMHDIGEDNSQEKDSPQDSA